MKDFLNNKYIFCFTSGQLRATVQTRNVFVSEIPHNGHLVGWFCWLGGLERKKKNKFIVIATQLDAASWHFQGSILF